MGYKVHKHTFNITKNNTKKPQKELLDLTLIFIIYLFIHLFLIEQKQCQYNVHPSRPWAIHIQYTRCLLWGQPTHTTSFPSPQMGVCACGVWRIWLIQQVFSFPYYSFFVCFCILFVFYLYFICILLTYNTETLELSNKLNKPVTAPVAVTSLSFPDGEVNSFLVGSEEGAIFQGYRHGTTSGITERY